MTIIYSFLPHEPVIVCRAIGSCTLSDVQAVYRACREYLRHSKCCRLFRISDFTRLEMSAVQVEALVRQVMRQRQPGSFSDARIVPVSVVEGGAGRLLVQRVQAQSGITYPVMESISQALEYVRWLNSLGGDAVSC